MSNSYVLNRTPLVELLRKYSSYLHKDEETVQAVETSLRSLSLLLSCFSNGISLSSELSLAAATSLESLRGLLKDCGDKIQDPRTTLRAQLSLLDAFEVFVELAARTVMGRRGILLTLLALQLTKCLTRLRLLCLYNVYLVSIGASSKNGVRTGQRITLQRSKLVIQRGEGVAGDAAATLDMAERSYFPDVHERRNWRRMKGVKKFGEVIAESLYAVRPVVHLTLLLTNRGRPWRSFLAAAALEATSLLLWTSSRDLKAGERAELSRRGRLLALFALRSPAFNFLTLPLLEGISQLVGRYSVALEKLINWLLSYLRSYQRIYGYVWYQ